jgi:mono/diheme cytochrome c family protein
MFALGILDDETTPQNPVEVFSLASPQVVTPQAISPLAGDDDPNGIVDFDGDGTGDEINIGCEGCHGPGSIHVETRLPADIVNPALLTADQADLVCGRCHNRGGSSKEGFTDFFAEASPTNPAHAPFPALLEDGNVVTYPPGVGANINDYYVWDGHSDPNDAFPDGSFDAQYWGGEPGGGTYVTSKQHHQQYIDILQGPHAPASGVVCFSCHKLHDNRSPADHQIVTSRVQTEVGGVAGTDDVVIRTANNDDTLCLSCHAGLPPFDALLKADVANVFVNGKFNAEVAGYKEAVTAHTQHYFDPMNQDGSNGSSRCTRCHMPLTAKSAIAFDISSHTFNLIQPQQSLSTSPAAGVPNACTQCHPASTDEELQVLQTAFDAKFPLTDGTIDPAARTNLIIDEWATSGHADYAGEPFNHWNVDGEVPTTCAKCHTRDGYADFAEDGVVDQPARLGEVLSCGTCHTAGNTPEFLTNENTRWDDRATFTALEPVTFPSGATATLNGPSNMCMACHQGRASGVDVQEAIDEADQHGRFINRHYFAAAAILFGSDVTAHFEYPGRTYLGQHVFPGHGDQLSACVDCHMRSGIADHTFEPQITDCNGCHQSVTADFEQLGLPFGAANVDYDGDGTGESFQGEIDGFAGDGVNKPAGTLLTAIQNYAANVIGTPIQYVPGSYPYFFRTDTGGSYNIFDDRLLAAAFNFHSAQDPCSDIHNYKYVLQALYDSLDDLDDNQQNNSVAGTRPGDGVQPPPGGNQAPVASAGADQSDVAVGSPVQLDGSASSDPEGTALTFNWSVTQAPAGSTATVVNPTTPTFTPDVAGSYTIQLEVSDGEAAATDTVTITTAGSEPPPGGNVAAGQTVYVGNCQGCHSVGTFDTTAEVGPDLTGDSALVTARFQAGQPGIGALHGGITLDATQITNLVAFIDSQSP